MNLISKLRFSSMEALLPVLPDHAKSLFIILNSYKWPLLSLFLFISGWYIGRILKENKLENALLNFQHCTDQEQQMMRTQKSLDQKFGVIRKFIGLLLFMSLLYSAIVVAQVPRNRPKSEIFHRNQLLWAWILFLITSLWVVSTIKNWRVRKIQISLQGFLDLKDHYLQEFVALIGTDIKVGIIRGENKRLAEKLESENKRLSEMVSEKKALDFAIQSTKKSQTIEDQNRIALEQFVTKIVSYEWCEKCYNEEAIRLFVEEKHPHISPKVFQETVKPKESAKDVPQTTANQETPRPQDCQQNCLLRYHLFCDGLHMEFLARIQEIKSASKGL